MRLLRGICRSQATFLGHPPRDLHQARWPPVRSAFGTKVDEISTKWLSKRPCIDDDWQLNTGSSGCLTASAESVSVALRRAVLVLARLSHVLCSMYHLTRISSLKCGCPRASESKSGTRRRTVRRRLYRAVGQEVFV
jgi:hypothetical protein